MVIKMQSSSSSEKVDIRTAVNTLSKSISTDTCVQDEVVMVADDEVDSNIIDHMKSLSVSKNTNGTEENKPQQEEIPKMLPESISPSPGVPERIVIVIDRALDGGEEKLPFESSAGKKYTCFDMLKRAVTMFVHNKAIINNEHQFALMFLNEDAAEWVLDFQDSPDAIMDKLNVKSCGSGEFLSLDSIFESIRNKVTLFSNAQDKQCNSPSYIVRVLFMFARSKCLPILNKTPMVNKILNSPFFFFDVLMSHGPPSDDNQCDQYFKYLTSIDMKGTSYAYCVPRNCKEVHEAAAKLLSHPLQRPKQSEAHYNLPKTEEN